MITKTKSQVAMTQKSLISTPLFACMEETVKSTKMTVSVVPADTNTCTETNVSKANKPIAMAVANLL